MCAMCVSAHLQHVMCGVLQQIRHGIHSATVHGALVVVVHGLELLPHGVDVGPDVRLVVDPEGLGQQLGPLADGQYKVMNQTIKQ